MPIANILVAYNGTPAADAALALATQFSRHHDAHLTGVFAHAMPSFTAHAEPYMSPEVLVTMARHEEETETRVTKAFAARLEAEGLAARSDFHAVRGQPNDVCAAFARTYDLVVIGQPEGDTWEQYHEPYPDIVALRSGRAVLVAPNTARPVELPGDMVIAWDGTRAAARALAEGMNLAEQAGRVMVLHIGDDDSAVRQPGQDVMEHLSRHGIAAELHIEPRGNRPVGQALRETAEAMGASILVMGAYEHSRFSEAIFGGATRDVLDGVKVPVLMAH